MLTYVLDSSSVIRSIDAEAGSERLEELFELADKGQCLIVISAVNWGEVVYIVQRRPGPQSIARIAMKVIERSIRIFDATAVRAIHSGLLKVKYGIGYADAFGVELALDSVDHVLVTADYGAKAAEHDIQIEFLPTKPRP